MQIDADHEILSKFHDTKILHYMVSGIFSGFTFDLSPLRKVGGFYKVTNDKDFDFLLNVCGPLTGTKCDASNITDPGICQVKKEQENRYK